ncbi:MAG: PilN domain-containing protein [Polyangiaceae bacterium]|nr:PilN domain-containing protein [Polyangiaceae bacterium]
MIRINLLPQKRRGGERREGTQLWLLLMLMLVLAQVSGLFVFHAYKVQELEEQTRKNREHEARIAASKQAVRDHAEVTAKLQQLRAREDAIAKLQSARTGPTSVLLELARILTPGRGPSVVPEVLDRIRREDPLGMYNPNWDSRRLWLTSFIESQRKVRLKGLARDGEDVSELARRMNISAYFQEVQLLPASRVGGKEGLDLIGFELEAKVKY